MFKRLDMIIMIALSLWSVTASTFETKDKRAFACDCIERQSPREALEKSDAVFSGRVIGVKGDDYVQIATVDVYTAWKGIDSEPVTVSSNTPADSCGFGFSENEELLIYARYSGESNRNTSQAFSTSICTRTTSLDRAQEDLVSLGEGKELRQAIVYNEERWSNSNVFLLVGIAAAVIGAITSGILLRRWRKLKS